MLFYTAIIILFGSAIGIGVILVRKAPLLTELSGNYPLADFKGFYSSFRGRLDEAFPLKNISLETLLQKILSKTRVLILKLESKISFWLQHLRQNSHKRKAQKQDNYGQELNGSASGQDKENHQV